MDQSETMPVGLEMPREPGEGPEGAAGAEPTRTYEPKPARAYQGLPGPATACQGLPGPAKACQGLPGPARA